MVANFFNDGVYPAGQVDIENITGWENFGGQPQGLPKSVPLMGETFDDGFAGDGLQRYEIMVGERQPWIVQKIASMVELFGNKSFMGLCAVKKPVSYPVSYLSENRMEITGRPVVQTQLSFLFPSYE